MELTHQLQNRLAVMRACVQLALSRCSCERARVHLQRALASADDAGMWVQVLARGASALGRSWQRLRLDLLAAQLADEFSPLFERSGVALHAQLPQPQGLWVDGSPALLRAAISHLLANAAEASPPGSTVRLQAAVYEEASTAQAWACVCVEDSGPGLPEEVLARLFHGPVSTKAPAGRGLGLLSAYRTVRELHGGWVSAVNLPGGGARVCIGLPLRPPPEPGL